MTPIERVARAVEAEVDKLADVRNIGGFYDQIARAAIQALREPSEAMEATGGEAIYLRNGDKTPETEALAQVAWRAMVDAALAEGEG